jgi:hypothetical protein
MKEEEVGKELQLIINTPCCELFCFALNTLFKINFVRSQLKKLESGFRNGS